MKTWRISYKDKNYCVDGTTTVKAENKTMALVEFMVKHPDCIYTGVEEIENNESKS